MFSSLKILKSNYLFLIITLILCYTAAHTTLDIFYNVDYIIIVYLFFLPFIDDDTIIAYSFIFGLFFDFLIDSYLGVGVLLFMALSFLKVSWNIMFGSGKFSSRLSLNICIIILFTLFNLLYFGYEWADFLKYGFERFIIDLAAYLVIFLILELLSAFSYSKR